MTCVDIRTNLLQHHQESVDNVLKAYEDDRSIILSKVQSISGYIIDHCRLDNDDTVL